MTVVAVDERDRRRAIWVWPSLYVLGFWVPLVFLVWSSVPKDSLTRRHAARALQLYLGFIAVAVVLLMLVAATGGSGAAAWFLVGGTATAFVVLSGIGLATAVRSPVASGAPPVIERPAGRS